MKLLKGKNANKEKRKISKKEEVAPCFIRGNTFTEEINPLDFKRGVFKECTFKNLKFDKLTFQGVAFENCSFEECFFSSCNTEIEGFIKFCHCDVRKVIFNECSFKNLKIKESNLIQVEFEDTFMSGCILSGNSYEGVRFIENCNLMDAKIEDNYKRFDITFINEKSYTKLNYGTYIGRYLYKKINLTAPLEENNLVNLSISSTYMDLGGQFLRNNVGGKYGVCFYEGKRAYHRTLKGKRRILSNIYDIVCGYGEKPSRTFSLSFLLIVFFAFLYMLAGLKTLNEEVISLAMIGQDGQVYKFIKLLINSIYFSTVTFATVGYGDIMVVNSAGMVISIVEIIIGVFMIGVWTSTLVRKMTR